MADPTAEERARLAQVAWEFSTAGEDADVAALAAVIREAEHAAAKRMKERCLEVARYAAGSEDAASPKRAAALAIAAGISMIPDEV